MNELPSSDQDRYAIVKYKKNHTKTIIVGIVICSILSYAIYYLLQGVKSIEARIETNKEIIYSPVAGRVVDLPLPSGSLVEKGEAVLRFDPIHIRRENSMIRDYWAFYQQNRNNPGLLKQKFSPIFAQIFGEYSNQRKYYLDMEKNAIKLYEEKSKEHSRLLVQIRNPKNQNSDGSLNQDLVQQEKIVKHELDQLLLEVEKSALARADIDRQSRQATNDLSQSYGMLHIYLEEEQKRIKKLVQNEYLYSNSNGKMGEIFVNVGDIVAENDLLYEILPDASGQWNVIATFTANDASELTLRDVCTVETEDGLKFVARIESMKPKDGFVEVKLIIQTAPEGLKATNFATVYN